MTDEALLPCPFCGGKADLVIGAPEAWVRCMECGASGDTAFPERAAALWNRRAALTAIEAAGAASNAIADIAAERRRQIEAEGWAPEHDDKHVNGELAGAAGCYALYRSHLRPAVVMGGDFIEAGWPWSAEWWKPTMPRRDLVKAGALILAEIERLDRAAAASAPDSGDAV